MQAFPPAFFFYDLDSRSQTGEQAVISLIWKSPLSYPILSDSGFQMRVHVGENRINLWKQLSGIINLKQRISYRADKRPVLLVRIAGPSPQALFRLRKIYGKPDKKAPFVSAFEVERGIDGSSYHLFPEKCPVETCFFLKSIIFELNASHNFSVNYP